MRRTLRSPKALLIFALLVSGSGLAGYVVYDGRGAEPAWTPPAAEEMPARDLIRVYCGGCHVSGRSGVDFDDAALDLEVMRSEHEIWTKAVQYLRSNKMPPARAPQPLDADRATMIDWLEKEVLAVDSLRGEQTLAVRRLQRSEYLNAVRNLLGVTLPADLDLPRDDSPGWRRRESIPTLSPEDADKYRAAAQRAVEEALAAPRADSRRLDLAGVLESLSCEEAESRQEALSEKLAACARRAFRRPIQSAELEQLLVLFEEIETETGSTEKALRGALVEIFCSPHFLYRIESRRTEANPDSFELASRLSFFLWDAPPDDELLKLAESGSLTKDLEAQTRRMLNAPQAQGFSNRVANHWLQLDKLDETEIPADLRILMRAETERFVADVVNEDRPVTEFLRADYTYVNERLARHYGIAGVRGEHLRRVSLQGTQRGGLLTHASVLAISSPSVSGTSPVLRGKWVLENLLGQPVPRPPAGILEALKNSTPESTGFGTLRQQTERHRANTSCAQCHIKMDAIGLSLENFDFAGAWRDKDRAQVIDATGVLSDTETLHGPAGTRAYLLRHSRDLVRAIGGKLLGAALGRKLDQSDRDCLPTIADNVARDDYRFSRIVLEVVQSPSFLRGNRAPLADGEGPAAKSD